METKTKIILGIIVVGTIAYLTRDKWMSNDKSKIRLSENKKENSDFTALSLNKKNSPIVSKQMPSPDWTRCDCKTGNVIGHYTDKDGNGYTVGTGAKCNCGSSKTSLS